MRHFVVASALMFAVAHGAYAADAPKAADAATGANMGAKLTLAECDALWLKADAAKTGKLPEAAAQTYLTDMKAVNADGDTTIEKPEFTKACEGGMIKKEAAAGAGAPVTTGSTNRATDKTPAPGETSDRTPGAKNPTPPEQMDSSGGNTSDRTPNK